MAPPPAPKIIFGTAGIATYDDETITSMLEVLKTHNVGILDTASIYSQSEITLKKYNAPKNFEINTKAPGFKQGALSKQGILQGLEKSLEDLGVDGVDLYYFHSPDPATPIEESLSAIREAYAAGKFKRFGLSNFLPADVQKIHEIQKAANSVLPTVFQGNYNPVSRHIEEDLFPLLRKLNISFYAYSPIAGGFLVKDAAAIRSQDVEGRFGAKTGSANLYATIYGKESLLGALEEWGDIAREAGVSKAALAYRWVSYHSALRPGLGDGIIVGARKMGQLEETLVAIQAGPLDKVTAEKAGAVWSKVKAEAPRDNWNSFGAIS
ncbi:Oxidoreductase sirO [Lachnellula arida]|uniref:Oxidoreductase sirO n=1 Tax=Lachnellula arida TaxID=1316785 RepID=A0A8T9B2U4_9HELO|nr:Oxidoreductase sirO [Lachnellula arida]